ncbi:MAG: serine hydrolase domain-containing protein [Chitinophagaceae bacterium]
MSVRKFPPIIISILLFVSLQVYAQTRVLPRSTPEAEGVSSKNIISFLEAAAKSKHEFHSIMMLRHGKVIAEGWWKPYRPELKHTMYSVSKSFTSTAVGFAVSEKRITVNDKVISFFPDKLPATISPNLSELTIKNLLTMAVGQDPDPTGPVISMNEDWIKAFLALPISSKPGSKFLYNSMATYMLSAIVQKVTKQKIIDYLRPRLFQPLGITGVDWEIDPAGINTGGWGFRIKTEDLAKFGQLYLQKGKWKGKQVLPLSWIEEATTKKIEQTPELSQAAKDSSDWRQGYCYQFWRSRHNTYRGDGAFGQYILVFPEQDAVIAITSETGDMQGELDLVWEHLLPAFTSTKSIADKKGNSLLKQKLLNLSINELSMATDSSVMAPSFNFTYLFEPNAKKIKTIQFDLNNNNSALVIKDDTATYKLNLGSSSWKMNETTRRGPSLVGAAKNHFVGLPATKVAGKYGWIDGSTIEIILRYLESPHTEKLTCKIDGNTISIETSISFSPNAKIPVLKGVLNK